MLYLTRTFTVGAIHVNFQNLCKSNFKKQELNASPQSCFIFSRFLESRVAKQLLSELSKYIVIYSVRFRKRKEISKTIFETKLR